MAEEDKHSSGRSVRSLRRSKAQEALGILVMACSLFLLVSLLSYDPLDPSFFSSGHAAGRSVNNYAGRLGAELAGDLFEVFGLSALLFPPFVFFLGFKGLSGRGLPSPFHVTALVLLLLSVSLLSTLFSEQRILVLSIFDRPGGFLGDELYRRLSPFVGRFGLYLVTVTFLLLTLVLSLLLFPFRIKQMVSMKKMQVIQPKVKEIQERYKRYKKTDPKRAEMNQEVMALYKAHNVNPLGGCLPLLLQMPLLFAFYQLLAVSIELRQAPFFGWVQDLSIKDPFYVLPIIMGVTMLISQKITPMSPGMDPVQAKMMMMMPVIFTVMFLNVSSGLNLYFLCSNIFQIAMQKVAERWMGDGRPARAAKA